MTKLNHLIELILTLQYKELTSASELSQILEVNKKTVYRYIETLVESDIPVMTKKGRYGGFYLDKSFFMKQPKLEREEVEALIMAADILTNQKGFTYEKSLRNAVSKIKSTVLSSDEEFQDMKHEPDFNIKQAGMIEGLEDNISKINIAMSKCRVIDVSYYSRNKNSFSKIKLEPYSLFYKGGEWILVGNDNITDEFKSLFISRVRKVLLTEDIYFKHPDFEINRQTIENSADLAESDDFIKIKFSEKVSDLIIGAVWHSSQTIEKMDDGSIILKMISSEYDDLLKWVLGFGYEAEILEPVFLRDQAKQQIEKMFSLYS